VFEEVMLEYDLIVNFQEVHENTERLIKAAFEDAEID
jgi:hypothetical protein